MKKSLIRSYFNRVLNVVVRWSPGSTSLRPLLHRARGVSIGQGVFIGDEVYIDNEYPECIEIHDRAAISIRAIIIAHNKGPGKVIIEKEAFVGPQVIVACNGGRVVRIGEGAVIAAGCVVTKNVPPHAVLTPPPAQISGQAAVSLVSAGSIEEFWSGLRPLRARVAKSQPKPGGSIPDDSHP